MLFLTRMSAEWVILVDPRVGEVKDGQWLGVSVESQGTEEGKAVVSKILKHS